PGDAYRTILNKLDFISLAGALVLGTVGLPHIVNRFFTVPDGRAARTSVSWAIGPVGVFYLMTLALGFGAAALVGRRGMAAPGPRGNTGAPLRARAVGEHLGRQPGGGVMLASTGAVACATSLSVVSGLVLAACTSLAHGYCGQVLMFGRPRGSEEVGVARFA